MERFSAFEDVALTRRIERLERAEHDLQQRTTARISQVDAEGRWLRSDPRYRYLSSALKKVREDLRETKDALSRRNTAVMKRAA